MTTNIGDIITTTLRNQTKSLADNVTENNALLMRLNEKGNIKPVSGGYQIMQEVDNAENGTFMWYSGYSALDLTPQHTIDAATFDWKQAAVAVTISGLEEIKNNGKEAIIDLLESRIKNAQRTMNNNIGTGIYSDGTGSGGQQMGGLQYLISSTPTTGTVGGFDRSAASNAWWRNISTTFTGLSLTAGADTIQSAMNALYVQLVRGNDAPDLIVADNTYWRYYLESLQGISRIVDGDKIGKMGFKSLSFMNADVILDGGKGGNCPANTMYMLNTDYLFFRPAANRNMVSDGKPRMSVNQDAEARLILFAGNMTMSNASLQGVLTA